jgi:hypothetical protein
MSSQITPQLHVDIGAAATLEFHLTIAGAHENITVSAAPTLVETQPTAVSTLLDERALNDIPLNGRRFSDLALFSPNVTQDPRSLTSSTNGDLSFGSIRGFQTTTLVDGGDYNNAFFSEARARYRAPFELSTEVVQEFRPPRVPGRIRRETTKPPTKPWSSPPAPNSLPWPENIPPRKSATPPTPSSTSISLLIIN